MASFQNSIRMRFVSSRGQRPSVSFQEAVQQGFAPDGGMYVPEEFVPISDETLKRFKTLSFSQALAEYLIPYAISSIEPDKLKQLVDKALSTFPTTPLAPFHPLNRSTSLYDLSGGPTGAFKDYGMTVLFQLIDYFTNDSHVCLVIDTTGDTGPSAAACAVNKSAMDLFILYPAHALSRLQTAQLHCPPLKQLDEWNNIHVLAVRESGCDQLDDVIYDLFKQDLPLGSVNSVNIVRILVQSFFYIWAALQHDQRVRFFIPTGASGNLLGAIFAAQTESSLQFDLVAATNDNKPLQELLENGRLCKRPGLPLRTFSNAVDVLNPYNIWRILYLTCAERNANVLSSWQDKFENGETVQLTAKELSLLKDVVSSVIVSEEETLASIKLAKSKYSAYICPHTALAFHAAENDESDVLKLVLVTAHPSKFSEASEKALGEPATIPEYLSGRSETNHAGVSYISLSHCLEFLSDLVSTVSLRRNGKIGYSKDSLLTKWEIAHILGQHFSHPLEYFYQNIVSFCRTKGGYSNLNYIVKMVDREYFIKVAVPGSSIHLNMDELYTKLQTIQTYVGGLESFPSCKVFPSNPPIAHCYDGRPVLVMERITGSNPQTCSKELASEIGAGLASLHQIRVPENVQNALLPDFYFSMDGMSQACELLRESKEHGEFYSWLSSELTSIKYLFEEGKPLAETSPKVFCHGDVFLDNLIVQESGSIAAFVDFEEACWSARTLELALTICGCCEITNSPEQAIDLSLAACFVQAYVASSREELSSTEQSCMLDIIKYATLGACEWRYSQFNVRFPDPERSSVWKQLSDRYNWICANSKSIVMLFSSH